MFRVRIIGVSPGAGADIRSAITRHAVNRE